MKAKFINEAIFEPKSSEDLNVAQEDFMRKYGTRYSPISETVKRLNELGVHAHETDVDYDESKISVIELETFTVFGVVDNAWKKIGDCYTEKDANDVIGFLSNKLVYKKLNSDEPNFKYEKREWNDYMSNTKALKLIARLENES